jgi:glycine/D-amino acid oxidase-like deaminating enzyme
MSSRFIVIGGGIMGLSSAWALHKAGHRVCLFEQGKLPNEHGSSVDQHRLIRHAYGAQEGYTRMINDAFGAWEQLWRDLGRRHYAQTGTFAMVGRDQPWAEQSLLTLERVGIPVERLSPDQVAQRWPFLDNTGFEEAFFLSSGGALFTRRIIRDLSHYLADFGVEIYPNSQVIDLNLDRCTVQLADGHIEYGDGLVIAAGPWVTKLLPSTTTQVTPSRQVVFYLHPPRDLQAALAASPMILDIGVSEGIYIVPPVAGTGLKVGEHSFSLQGDPDAQRFERHGERERIAELCSRRFRDFHRYRVGQAKICFYAVAAEERFIVRRIGSSVLMTGFSGHGFKFGALMGQAAAVALTDPERAGAIEQWAAGRSLSSPLTG